MGICRLCLENLDGTGISNPEETIKSLQTFLPHMNRTLINQPVICEICFKNVNTANQLLETKNSTDTKIHVELRRLKVAKIDLKDFHKNLYMSGNIGVCRICLNLVNRPRIFLCENSTNILRHDFIKIMLNYCNLRMNFEVSNKPVMCLKCWELLQVVYTFKKDYQEVERKIREYCREFRLRNRNLSVETLEKVKNYFSEEYCEIIGSNIKQENGLVENMCSRIKKEKNAAKNNSEKNKRVSRRVKKEKVIKNEEFSGMVIPRKQHFKFSNTDNMTLMRVYYEVTNNEQDFHIGYWQRLYDKWIEVQPDKPVTGRRLSAQIHYIVRKKLLSKAKLEKIRAEVNARAKVQAHVEQTVENHSDSDDSFMEEAVHSSFTPHIKSEPLSDSDVDVDVEYIEPKQEVESDCESLPQLERMDLPSLQIKVENIFSLAVKREAFDNYMQQDDELSITSSSEDVSKNRRESLRGHNKDKDLFECPDCNFKTTDRASAERHMRLHQRRNQKIHQCTSCPYRIASKWLFNRHMKKHKAEEDEIPVLMPDALMSSIHL